MVAVFRAIGLGGRRGGRVVRAAGVRPSRRRRRQDAAILGRDGCQLCAPRFAIALGLVVVGLSGAGGQSPPQSATVTLFEGARLIAGDGGAPDRGLGVSRRERQIHPRRAAGRGAGARRRRPRRSDRQDGHPRARRCALAHRLHEEPDERCRELHAREHPRSHAPVRVLRRRRQPGDGQRLRRDAVSAARRDPGREVPGRRAIPHGRSRAVAARRRSARTTCGRRRFRSPRPKAPAPPSRSSCRGRCRLVKTWVDDRGGAVKKLTPDLYGAIIDEAHKNKLRVAVHATDLQDAKDLLRAGIDVFAHMISDVDDELVALFKQHPEHGRALGARRAAPRRLRAVAQSGASADRRDRAARTRSSGCRAGFRRPTRAASRGRRPRGIGWRAASRG